jgi:hypothetical protein
VATVAKAIPALTEFSANSAGATPQRSAISVESTIKPTRVAADVYQAGQVGSFRSRPTHGEAEAT